ncbi:MAG: phosphohistidine phosphatase SixA [Thaumarchaeota archaeon]|nr:phosphohistidine phosphatase SixA [Nitrososphaerota archaeon]
MNIFILRHGEAGTHASLPSKDSERELTEAGRSEVERIANSLHCLRVEFDKIATSPLKRAKETAEIVSRVYENNAPKLEIWDELRPEGNMAEAIQRLSKLKQDSDIMIVGHEPYLSTFIGEIISGNAASRIVLKKGGIAKVQIHSFAPKLNGELRWLLTPRILRKISN